MGGIWRNVCAVSAVTLAVLAASDRGLARPATVRPPAISTAPLELADLIALALPASGALSPWWDYMATAPVAWRRANYERDSQGNMVRVGLARVRVAGRIARKLGRQPVELPWTIMLQGSPNPERGVIGVHISPGSLEQACVGDVADCLFRVDDVFNLTTVQYRRLCFVGADEAYQGVYAVTAPGRRPGFAVFTRNFGPVGGTVRVDVLWNGTPPDCKDPSA